MFLPKCAYKVATGSTITPEPDANVRYHTKASMPRPSTALAKSSPAHREGKWHATQSFHSVIGGRGIYSPATDRDGSDRLDHSFSVMAVHPGPRPKTASGHHHVTSQKERHLVRKHSVANSKQRSHLKNKCNSKIKKQNNKSSEGSWKIQLALKAEEITFWDVAPDPEIIQSRLEEFYKRVVTSFDQNNSLSRVIPDVNRIYAECTQTGSILVDMTLGDVTAVARLRDLYNSLELEDVFNKALITEALLWDLQIVRVRLTLTIDESQFEQCHVSSACSEIKSPRMVDASTSDVQESSEDESNELEDECLKALRLHSIHLQEFVINVKERYAKLNEQMSSLHFALQMATPSNSDTSTTMSGIIACHLYLRRSPSVGKSVRTDLVKEFVTIVNLIRIKTNESRYHISVALEYVRTSARHSLLQECHQKMLEVSNMLQLEFDFSNLTGEPNSSVGKLQNRLFPGLTHFIPNLLTKASELQACMSFLVSAQK